MNLRLEIYLNYMLAAILVAVLAQHGVPWYVGALVAVGGWTLAHLLARWAGDRD